MGKSVGMLERSELLWYYNLVRIIWVSRQWVTGVEVIYDIQWIIKPWLVCIQRSRNCLPWDVTGIIQPYCSISISSKLYFTLNYTMWCLLAVYTSCSQHCIPQTSLLAYICNVLVCVFNLVAFLGFYLKILCRLKYFSMQSTLDIYVILLLKTM